MAANIGLITKKCFPSAIQVTDRFHLQKIALEALQEIRIKHRSEVIDSENNTIKQAKKKEKKYTPTTLPNGDTIKQLLVRSAISCIKTNLNGLNLAKRYHEYQRKIIKNE